MNGRLLALALNTYREAARDRVPLGLFGAGLAVALTSLVVAAMSLGRDPAEVVAVLTSSAISLFSVVGALVIGASILYKDLERKTIYPILARPVFRHEVVLGKHLGLMATISTFCCLNTALSLTITALTADSAAGRKAIFSWVFCGILLAVVLFRRRDKVVAVLVFAPLVLAVVASVVGPLGDLRTLLLVSAALSLVEAAIVAATAMAFGSFSTPFLTAALTAGVVAIGRNADMLERLPERTFGPGFVAIGKALAKIVPNLNMFVPPRVLATGRTATSAIQYVAEASAYGVLYVVVLLAIACVVFQRRNFA